MKKVFLESLPFKQTRNKKHISWVESVGFEVGFIYNGVKGNIKIVDYNRKKQELKLEYNKNIKHMNTGNFVNGHIGDLISKINRNYKYNTNDIISNIKSGKLLILQQIMINNTTAKNGRVYKTRGYKYKCLICNNTDSIKEVYLTRGRGCNVCCLSPRKVQVGYNDITTTDPNFASLFWNKDDAKKHTIGSSKKVDFKCPECSSKIKNRSIYCIYNYKLSCPKCSDGISYPEKFIYNLLRQNKINFIYQYSPHWSIKKGKDSSKRLRYDFYLPEFKCIVEIHGRQHYEEDSFGKFRSLKDERRNDRIKKELALTKGTKDVNSYIVMKADKSDAEYLKNNILDTALNSLIDFSNTDWGRCDMESQKSLLRVVCNYWNQGITSTQELMTLTNLSNSTIKKYLKKGSEIKLCDYNPRERMRESGTRSGFLSGIPVVQLSLENKFIGEFNSASQAARRVDGHNSNISMVCKGKRRVAYGYKWMYKEDYEKYIAQAP